MHDLRLNYRFTKDQLSRIPADTVNEIVENQLFRKLADGLREWNVVNITTIPDYNPEFVEYELRIRVLKDFEQENILMRIQEIKRLVPEDNIRVHDLLRTIHHILTQLPNDESKIPRTPS